MAQSIAWRYIRRIPGADADEILSVAYEGLVKAGSRWIDYCEARGFEKWSADDPDQPESHFGGLIARYVNGHILDHCRSADRGVTRTQRRAVKVMDAAFDDGIRGEEEQARAAGLTVEKAREARAAAALTTVSLDDHADTGEYAGPAIRDAGPGVAEQAELNATMTHFMICFDGLPAIQQVLLSLVFHQDRTVREAAEQLGLSQGDARRLHDSAVTTVHAALYRAVEAEGTGPRRPAPVRVSSADGCRAAEAGGRVKRCADCGEKLPVEAFSFRDRAKGYKVPYCRGCASARAAACYAKRRESVLTS